MTKKPKRRSVKADLELDPDGWARFEQFVTGVAKAGPKHRPAKAKERPPSKGRVRKGKSGD